MFFKCYVYFLVLVVLNILDVFFEIFLLYSYLLFLFEVMFLWVFFVCEDCDWVESMNIVVRLNFVRDILG